MSSKLFFETIKETKTGHEVDVIITTQRIKNDTNGNPRHFIQVWLNKEGGILFTPHLKNYKRNKQGGYNIQAHSIEDTIEHFKQDLENAINDI